MIKNLLKNEKYTFLVTGGAGFIGSNICEELIKLNQKVICLDNFSSGSPENISKLENSNNFTLLNMDIRNLDDCILASKNVDYIIHLAAFNGVFNSINNIIQYEENNVIGTLNIFEAGKINNVKKIVYASSSSVYGKIENGYCSIGEENEVISPYALTKYTCENYSRLYSEYFNIQIVGLRYFNVYGPKQRKSGNSIAVIPRFINSIMNNDEVVIYGNGKQKRDFTYIGNVTQATILACLSGKSKIYNVGCGETHTVLEILNTICRLLNKNPKVIFKNKRLGDIQNSFADITITKEELNYVPNLDLEKNILKTIQYYIRKSNTKND